MGCSAPWQLTQCRVSRGLTSWRYRVSGSPAVPAAMAAKANSQPRQWAKPGFMMIRDRLWMHLGIRKRPVNRGSVTALGVGPTYLHKRGHSQLFLVMISWLRRGVVFWCVAGRRLCGNGPALAGNVGTGSAFARSRDGDQGVDVPMLAPARSRCRFVFSRPSLIAAIRRINGCRL